MEIFVNECKYLLSSGKSEEDIILFMHDNGLTIIESIKVYRELYKVSLVVAKNKVAAAKCWRETAEYGDALHISVIKKLEGSDDDPK